MIKLVQNVKNHINALIKNEDFIELFDVNDNSVIFYIQSVEQLVEGVNAQPDGEFVFADGKKITIENGVVTKIEVAEQPNEETVVEPVNEGENVEVVEEQVVEQTKEEVLQAENDALKAEIEELKSIIEKLTEDNSKKDEDIKEAEACLKEVQNFYSKVSNASIKNRDDVSNQVEKQPNFRIIK